MGSSTSHPYLFKELVVFWTDDGMQNMTTKDLDIYWSSVDIEVSGSNIYIAALASGGCVRYWFSDDDGLNWIYDGLEISTFSWGHYMPPLEGTDLSVKDGNVGVLWMDDGLGTWEIEGMMGSSRTEKLFILSSIFIR